MTLLDDNEITQRLEGSQWGRAENAIALDLQFSDFAEAMAFVNQVAAIAEERNHHPDILVHGWNKVRLTVTNHSAGGLTDADFDLAQAIDAL
ncbi:MAG: 4a-hydroxytetrahydrobiopterin dehydratase [Solirubrobacteraceae bacterium]|jgi:4a-hydroxytetrahydrobiopterin dehydratase|nr:4a-hydroxytetrahydrobiopterin dehydratase [Solirubrobacteraceae bacterium]